LLSLIDSNKIEQFLHRVDFILSIYIKFDFFVLNTNKVKKKL